MVDRNHPNSNFRGSHVLCSPLQAQTYSTRACMRWKRHPCKHTMCAHKLQGADVTHGQRPGPTLWSACCTMETRTPCRPAALSAPAGGTPCSAAAGQRQHHLWHPIGPPQPENTRKGSQVCETHKALNPTVRAWNQMHYYIISEGLSTSTSFKPIF